MNDYIRIEPPAQCVNDYIRIEPPAQCVNDYIRIEPPAQCVIDTYCSANVGNILNFIKSAMRGGINGTEEMFVF